MKAIMLRERIQAERGFSLVEVLIVILIIGILAAIAIPAFLGQREKGQDSSAKSMSRATPQRRPLRSPTAKMGPTRG